MQHSYFLGGTSPDGFKSQFIKQIQKDDFYTYILKGGPGTGKSTLMKKIASRFSEDETELYYCSSDTHSLDAVVIKEKGIIIVDGTSPHVFDCQYPALSQEIVNLGQFWDKEYLKEHRDIIKKCCDENAKWHARARRFTMACSSLNGDMYSIASSALITEKLNAFIKRFSKKLFSKSSGALGKIDFKQLSALTADSYATQPLNPNFKIYTINDNFFAGADMFLRAIAENAVNSGLDIEVSEFNVLPTTIYEHVLIPQLGIAFVTQNFFNGLSLNSDNIINFNRFYDKDIITQKKSRLSFDKKASLEMLDEIAYSIKSALRVHDDIEYYYINAIDFSSLNVLTHSLLEEIDLK